MNIKEIRGCLPQVTKEQVLNIAYRAKDHSGVLAMLAEDKEGLLLWEICNGAEKAPEHTRRYRVPRTNRESQKSIFNQSISPFLHGLKIGDYVFSISSVSGSYIEETYNYSEQVQLVYLLSKGVQLGELEEEPLANLTMNCYRFSDKKMPELISKDYERTELTFAATHIPVRVNKRLKLSSGTYKKPRIVKIGGEEDVTVYISGVHFYDIWAKAEMEFEDKKYRDRFTKEELSKMKKQYLDMLPSICSKDCVLPVIEYECNKNYQMQFYTMDFLRRTVEQRNSFMLMNLRADKEYGPMGFENRVCGLEPVKKNFEGSFEVEIFNYYKVLPGQVISGQRL